MLLAIMMAGQVSSHGVQIAYTILNNGFVRVYIEHWHGPLNASSLVNNGMTITTSYGSTTVTQSLDASGFINTTTLSGLPAGSSGVTVLGTCSGLANNYNNWVYYDFAPATCGTPVSITISQGNTYLLTQACTGLYPRTINATFVDKSPPVITAPDITVTSCTAVPVTFDNLTVVDACDPNPTVTYSISSGSTFSPGTTQVTVTATDNQNYTSTKTFNVHVVPPTLNLTTTSNDPCEGEDLILTVTPVTGASYSWSGPNNFSSTAQNPVITNSSVSNSGTYTVTVSSGQCTYTASVVATVHQFGLLPTVATAAITNITPTTAVSGGTVDPNCETTTARGVCWNTTGSPTISDAHTTDGAGPGSYSSTLTGLTLGQTYYVRAYATNKVGTSYGQEYSFVASLNYCNPTTYYSCTYMHMTNVSTSGGITNFSNNSGCSAGYGDYSQTYSASQIQGGSMTMSFSSTGYPMDYSVWIDYNDDGVFSSNEKVISYDNIYGSYTVTASFTVPVNAASGSHRMRVRSEYYGYSPPIDPCNSVSYGEAEDYTFKVEANKPSDPTSITATADTICNGSSTTLTCNGAVGTVYWYTGGCGLTQVGTGNSLTVSPNATTTYYARNYENGKFSDNCANITVTVNTAPVISVPNNISLINDAGQCGAIATFNASATGTPVPTISYSVTSGSFFNVGSTPVVAVATNVCGSDTGSFTVSVTDNTLPTVITQNVTVQLDSNGQASISPNDVDNGSYDNCGIDTLMLDKSTFNCSDIGATSKVVVVTNSSWKKSTVEYVSSLPSFPSQLNNLPSAST
ncbi:MAG: HYR domain-containing protein, partial [Candidatus Hydrogenedentota bacterium]